jgi:F-type H+-transporting ATPase subunit gamma
VAQLIQMRQRIKAIETIKKITHAMRLIAMSNRTQLKGKEAQLASYTTTLTNLFTFVKHQAPDWTNPILYPHTPTQPPLIIVIGSQKGLCGSFNSSVFKLFDLHVPHRTRAQFNYVAVGKRAVDFVRDHVPHAPHAVYPEFSSTTLLTIATALTDTLFLASTPYSQVIVFSATSKSFFIQKPQRLQLIPFSHSTAVKHDRDMLQAQEYLWEQPAHVILDTLARQCIEATLQNVLFQSLLAEQAARFVSMDASTRNAQNLLETTELQYNKLRQAKITKELTELTGSF